VFLGWAGQDIHGCAPYQVEKIHYGNIGAAHWLVHWRQCDLASVTRVQSCLLTLNTSEAALKQSPAFPRCILCILSFFSGEAIERAFSDRCPGFDHHTRQCARTVLMMKLSILNSYSRLQEISTIDSGGQTTHTWCVISNTIVSEG
jgi:hypothetical protein